MKELTEKEKRFIEYYSNITNKDTFSNATRSYMAAYGIEDPNVAGVSSSRLLRKVKVMEKINELQANREFDLQAEVDEHIQNISSILKKVLEKGKYDKTDIQALRSLCEVAGKLGNRGVNINMDLRQGGKCPSCGSIRVSPEENSAWIKELGEKHDKYEKEKQARKRKQYNAFVKKYNMPPEIQSDLRDFGDVRSIEGEKDYGNGSYDDWQLPSENRALHRDTSHSYEEPKAIESK